MKRLNLLVPILTAVAALFAGTASAADEKEDILARFDRELLTVMSGFAEARESNASSTFRLDYQNTLEKFVQDANTLQNVVVELGIGEDLNLTTHARNLRSAFLVPVRLQLPINTVPGTATNQKNQKNNNKSSGSSVKKANDPLSNMTGKSLSEHAGTMMDSAGFSSTQNQMSTGFSFRMAGNAIQTLSSLGFGVRNGKYSVSPRYRRILPYLELKRDIEYYIASCEHFDSLLEVSVWRIDFEKRLSRMSKLAAQIQPIYRVYFPNKSGSITTEVDRLSRVYKRYIEYLRASKQAETQSNKNINSSKFDQVRTTKVPDKGLILKDYDTAVAYFTDFFADMDSVDWTVNPFSESGPVKDDAIKLPEKTSD